MTQQEYDEKRRECWEDFCRHIVDEEEEFYNMFDRAFGVENQPHAGSCLADAANVLTTNQCIFHHSPKLTQKLNEE